MQNYSHYSKWITEIIKSKSPLFEKASVDEFYLSVSEIDQYFGCYKWEKSFSPIIYPKNDAPINCCSPQRTGARQLPI
jgi:DNA polymerase-4